MRFISSTLRRLATNSNPRRRPCHYDDIDNLALKLMNGNRAALSRGITLTESDAERHRTRAERLMNRIARETLTTSSKRIGIAGPPGAGKSTFIESFGMSLIEKGHRVAVLAVDPSSTRTGGSILGDKTRMTYLSREENAYVRPSPTRGTLGGICLGTPEAVQLCEAAGYDYIIVETVGVGQSEVEVNNVVDMMMLLVSPAGGDSLQGVKKGIVEMSDMIVVNKNDGDLRTSARRSVRSFRDALTLRRHEEECGWTPKVRACSALERIGLDEIQDTIEEYYDRDGGKEWVKKRRARQRERWIWNQIDAEILRRLRNSNEVRESVKSGALDISRSVRNVAVDVLSGRTEFHHQ